MILSLLGKKDLFFFPQKKIKAKLELEVNKLVRFVVGILSIKNSFNYFFLFVQKSPYFFRDLKEIFAINYLHCWLLLREKQTEKDKTVVCKERNIFHCTTDATLNAYPLSNLSVI